jgi:NTE family protein
VSEHNELIVRSELQRAVDVFVHGRAMGASAVRPSDVDTTELERVLERIDVPGGTELFHRGDPGDSLYVITRGRLRVLLDEDGDVKTQELGRDQTVGELAPLTGEPRQGTVVAVRDSVVYRLSREDFERCVLTNPVLMRHLLVSLAQRLSRPAQRGRSTAETTNIAVLPAGSGAPVQAFAEALHRFLAGYTDTALVTAESLERTVGAGAIEAHPASSLGTRVHEHLSALEEGFRQVITVADDESSAWAVKCARGADVILLVGEAGRSAALNGLEARLFDASHNVGTARLHLVLIEPEAETTPKGTEDWLRDRRVEMCHHVHLARPTHFARLSRFIVGAPVGLVLSGGAARAFAHLGVMRALREASIPIDIVAGTSAGALVGAQFAMGWPPETIERVASELFGGPKRRMLDFIPPTTALIGATRFNAALDAVFGRTRFEDLWIQFLCTTTDLTSAQPLTHRQGMLRPAIRASCSLPMVMPPVTHNGHLLADGGIMNNVPVDPLLDVTNVGTLIVVNVTSPFYNADEAYNYDDEIPLRRVLSSLVSPRRHKLIAPGIVDVLMRSLEIGSKSLEPPQRAKADVYIRPDVSHHGYMDVADIAEIVAAGYTEATARLAEVSLADIPFAARPR